VRVFDRIKKKKERRDAGVGEVERFWGLLNWLGKGREEPKERAIPSNVDDNPLSLFHRVVKKTIKRLLHLDVKGFLFKSLVL